MAKICLTVPPVCAIINNCVERIREFWRAKGRSPSTAAAAVPTWMPAACPSSRMVQRSSTGTPLSRQRERMGSVRAGSASRAR